MLAEVILSGVLISTLFHEGILVSSVLFVWEPVSLGPR